jgi:hypothetical protein
MLTSELKELIVDSDFDMALCTGAETKNHMQTVIKQRNKDNVDVLYDIFLRSRSDIQTILDTKAKNRTDADKAKLKEFKKSVHDKYKMVREMLLVDVDDELTDEGVTNKLPKKLVALVDKLANVVQLMKYIGHTELEDELVKRGIHLSYDNLENTSDVFSNENIHNDVCDVFERSVDIAKDMRNGDDTIKVTIFENNVPTELRYDKDINPVGIKPSDFSKLVSLKLKEIQSVTEQGKAKLDNAVSKASAEKTYEMARAEIIRQKVMTMTPEIATETKEEDSLENAVDYNDR